MIGRIARILGILVLLLIAAAIGARLLISGPIGPLAGGELRGTLVEGPVADWGFTDEHMTIAVETRPEDPHSITTVCFVHEGHLYVPAQGGSGKDWTGYVLDDPRVRLGIGDELYPALATRVQPAGDARDAIVASAGKKYSALAEQPDRDLDEMDIWLFRIDPRTP